MAIRNPLALNRSLSLIIQAGQTGNISPYAARISLSRLSSYLIGAAIAYFITLMGTLLFFRELELNRKLQEHVLRLETERRLYQNYPLAEGVSTTALEATPAGTDRKSAASQAAKPEAVGPEVQARINDLRAECTEENCSIKLGMVTSQAGTAVGQLLLVLETEVPRIGTADASTPVRKRYFLYPGDQAKDELNPNELGTYEQKPFRFTRVLQTNTVFKMGKLLRPLAINAYVFDSEKSLIQHERKVIEGDE